MNIVTDRKEIGSHMSAFKRFFLKQSNQTFKDKTIGWPGGNSAFDVYWNNKSGLWAAFNDQYNRRYWNAFGLSDPTNSHALSITMEFNFPRTGLNRRVAGFFAEQAGSIYLCHSGKIGGGKKGVGKSAFMERYTGDTEEVEGPDGKSTENIVIGALGKAGLIDQLAEYVREIRDFKELSDSDSLTKGIPPFTPEFEGTRKPRRSKSIEANCFHGVVVRRLREDLQALGHANSNDKRDLFVFKTKSKRVTHLFEVKTNTGTQSIYTAVGQLLLYGMSSRVPPRRILVVPNEPRSITRQKLKRLNINILVYRRQGRRVDFPNLRRLMES